MMMLRGAAAARWGRGVEGASRCAGTIGGVASALLGVAVVVGHFDDLFYIIEDGRIGGRGSNAIVYCLFIQSGVWLDVRLGIRSLISYTFHAREAWRTCAMLKFDWSVVLQLDLEYEDS